MASLPAVAMFLGRALLGALFAAGAIQKMLDPQAAQALLDARGWPVVLVWPALVLNAGLAICLLTGHRLAAAALAGALYCMLTSLFHYVPTDPWQMSILVKNWAIAGGLLVLFAHASGLPARR